MYGLAFTGITLAPYLIGGVILVVGSAGAYVASSVAKRRSQ